jgi:hypothetical protein
MRTPKITQDSLVNQFIRAIAPNAHTALDRLVRDAGVKDTIAQLIIECLVQLGNDLWDWQVAEQLNKDSIQQLLNDELRNIKAKRLIQYPTLDMKGELTLTVFNGLHSNLELFYKGVDMHCDTPTEILHTIILGVVKYFWGQSVYMIAKAKQFDIFQA